LAWLGLRFEYGDASSHELPARADSRVFLELVDLSLTPLTASAKTVSLPATATYEVHCVSRGSLVEPDRYRGVRLPCRLTCVTRPDPKAMWLEILTDEGRVAEVDGEARLQHQRGGHFVPIHDGRAPLFENTEENTEVLTILLGDGRLLEGPFRELTERMPGDADFHLRESKFEDVGKRVSAVVDLPAPLPRPGMAVFGTYLDRTTRRIADMDDRGAIGRPFHIVSGSTMRLYDLPSDIVSISCLDTTGRVYSGKVARTHPTTLTETGNDGPFDIDWDRARTLVRDYGAVDLVFEVCIWP